MLWNEGNLMTERPRSIRDVRRLVAGFIELYQHQGQSRATGYPGLGRANQSGWDCRSELSRRPRQAPGSPSVLASAEHGGGPAAARALRARRLADASAPGATELLIARGR